MDLEYDTKFEEMKKYIPFLESMIRRLESTKSSSSSNPRQAQLDKIRSLRDLLLDKKKRMKMVNLLKCEQVLVNLYAKVEQKDTLSGISKPVSVLNSRTELESVRSKLKSLNTKSNDPETLPEIARASETEAICTPGSKEPALFQRRPNLEKATPSSPVKSSAKSPLKIKSSSKRSYTRVLVSPEPSERRWSASKDEISDKPLFSRRSPRKSPRRHSPFYHKKERKKSSKEKEMRKRKGLNITLNVPQHSLDSLNTDDILSRIINCSDSDVDISTLRELRSQILGELQKTGASDDISDLILKSYKHKKRGARKQEIEEGELSDSESEAIESVYGNLKIIEKGIAQSNVSDLNETKTNENDSSQRKIQICLVFNSESEAKKSNDVEEIIKDDTELEMFHEAKIGDSPFIKTNKLANKKIEQDASPLNKIMEIINKEKTSEVANTNTISLEKELCVNEVVVDEVKRETRVQPIQDLTNTDKLETCSNSNTGFKANFYKPLNEENTGPVLKNRVQQSVGNNIDINEYIPNSNRNITTLEAKEQFSSSKNYNTESTSKSTNIQLKEKLTEEIPLLGNDSRTVDMASDLASKCSENVSEIDILQALKNEILGESIAIPRAEQTPSLHQPKLIKVSNAQEVTKKRISIENYKAKSSNVSNAINPLSKKSSLNLTEKECERFNFSKIALDDSSDDEVQSTDIALNDIYGDFAPISPDNYDTTIRLTPPVIIPDEPMNEKVVNLQSDGETRKQPLLPTPTATIKTLNSSISEMPKNTSLVQSQEKKQRPIDPRIRKEIHRSVSKESPNPYNMLNSDKNRPLATNPSYPNMTPSMMMQSMTPSRTPSITPSHQTFEIDVPARSKHVYAPLLSNPDNNRENSDMDLRRRPHWENVKNDPADYHRNRNDGTHFDNSRSDTSSPSGHIFNNRSDCPSTPNPSFGRSEKPMTPLHQFGRTEMPMTPSHPFGRSEIPLTPTHPFGHGEIPMTPNHPFGRGETPLTPNHPFGRGEVPLTPSHPFGRSEMPMTPSHNFGRNEMPMTPSHQFSRGDMPMTPSHPFGRNEVHAQSFGRNDPRLNRSEHESNRSCDDKAYNRERNPECGKEFGRFVSEKSKGRTDLGHQHDTVRDDRFRREKSVSRNEKYQHYETSSDYNRIHREMSVGRHESETCEQRGRQYQREYIEDRFKSGHHIEESFKSSNRHPRDVSKFYEGQIRGERSVGRNASYEESRYHRVPNTERSYGQQQTKQNMLSVEPKTGRSFIIDTSVSNTFQSNSESEKLLMQKFDERRRRAASVGRVLNKEPSVGHMDDFNHRRQRASSVGRALKQNNEPFIENNSQYINHQRKDFRRCSSMGRDLQSNKSDKSFKDIKAEFTLYQMKENANGDKRQKFHNLNRDDRDTRIRDTGVRGNKVSNKLSPPANYSPRKNYRDPRMRREQQSYDKKNKYDKYRKDSYVKKGGGIVYSNDNIAKGAILGPGFGVKNYKIPKIKRPVDEQKGNDGSAAEPVIENTETIQIKTKQNIDNSSGKQESIKSTKLCDAKTKKLGQDDKIKKSKKIETKVQANIIDANTRETRPKRNNPVASKPKDNESPVMNRKNKKGVIYDSDSGSEDKIEKEKSKQNEENNKVEDVKVRDDEEVLLNNPEVLDSSFGIEDLDIFSDNMVSESNISAILADLDNDISTNKNANADKDVQNDSTKLITRDQALTEISQLIEEELNSSSQVLTLNTVTTKNDKHSSKIEPKNNSEATAKLENILIESSECMEKSLHNTENNTSHPNERNITEPEVVKPCQHTTINTNSPILTDDPLQKTQVFNNDAIVSTSDVKNSETITELEISKCGTSIPDSTIQTSNILKKLEQDRFPDSTNEISNENSTDISSTLKDETKTESSKDAIDSFGNLLTILQDKTKIKQLLAMLGDQGIDNEKIKKKLEKISEIVSDDEDTKNNLNKSDNIEKLSSTTLPHVVEKVDFLKNSKEILSAEDSKDLPCTSLSSKSNEQEDISKVVCKIQESDQISSLQEITKDVEPIQDSKITASPKKIAATEKQKTNKKAGRFLKQKKVKSPAIKAKRITRSAAAGKGKKKRGELQKLQDDIKEMFLSDDILNASGIRMCRLAKLLDEKTNKKEGSIPQDPEPKVVLEKLISKEVIDAIPQAEKTKKKPGPKPKIQEKEKKLKTDMPTKLVHEKDVSQTFSYRPGPKSKTRRPLSLDTPDPYAFETESANTSIASIENTSENSSDSENESLASSKSFGSTEPLIDLKKKKRRRRGWQVGVIKVKSKKKKPAEKNPEISVDSKVTYDNDVAEAKITIPDLNCFTDKKYCFLKNVTTYSCRLCHYEGDEIVHHYKKNHPHSEVPLSRMHPDVAKTAIQQCEEVNFQTISKLPTDKYICRFCFKEFGRKKNILEIFFWHIVSVHTGEYKQVCTECVNFRHCPFNLDIPPPPKDLKGQLIGYICDKCNFTQISLENLKLHVILRHNDEQTAVYTINLADMTEGTINELTKQLNKDIEKPESRRLRSSLSVKSVTESSINETVEKELISKITDEQTLTSKIFQTRISFENDDTSEVSRSFSEDVVSEVKDEPHDSIENEENLLIKNINTNNNNTTEIEEHNTPNDIVDLPHFKIIFTESGSKEYLCCINGNMHYRTPLLISFRKHVQKHAEDWDGYCFVCKVIVTPIGKHLFKQLLQHFIDNHMDNFPVEESIPAEGKGNEKENSSVESVARSYINVRPLAELLSTTSSDTEEMQSVAFPIIENIISLGAENSVLPVIDPPQLSPRFQCSNQSSGNNTQCEPLKYEEAQAEIMSKKHRVVLETMMTPDKLVRVFKCAGRFCSYTTDSTEEALVHASTHQRVGGDNALKCAYCDFDSCGNAIDLVMHVFKVHARSSFVCGHCFYRAAAPQLVGAHIKRIHVSSDIIKHVFKSTLPLPPTTDDGFMRELKREEACLYYVCNNGVRNMSAPCKFKTFTPGKFIDHLLQRHSSDNVYSCYLCSEDCASPVVLVTHLKTHGLRRYQCLWCVFGAEDEPELLAHASEKHPWKLPQGYLRIVTNKEGSDEYRVLPKALLNKNKVPFVELEPNTLAENATREAERSIDLEKLIGNLLLDSGCSSNQVEPIIVAVPENVPVDVNPVVMDAVNPPDPSVLTTPTTNLSTTTENLMPVLKTEAEETPTKNPEVICLDSDEDETPTQVKVISTKLFRCMKCKNICKTFNGFKRHVNHCYTTSDLDIICYHCSKKVNSAADLLIHLVKEHSIGDKYCCSLCNHTLSTISNLKKHMKNVHLIDKPIIKTQYKESQIINYAIAPPGLNKSKTPPKRSKYGPQDISALPINPILDELVYCSLCEFNTKVRLNMVRHLQLHAEQQPVAQTAPVNPVPHLETNEKYFDKMLNLASSSISINKSKKPETNPTAQVIPPEAAFRYPKYISDRQRYACGAKGCSYISVDEGMFKCHWETLHNGVNEFTCLHCPPNQHLDPNKPLNALRIITHLKMHDSCLYACSSCPYYHYRHQILEKHINENHSGKGSQVMIVRDENTTSPSLPLGHATISQLLNAPTMDLKPWQCGLCQFKSMLRQEINDHCNKVHQSKMQYKCSHCPYRASTLENVRKHQKNSHPDKDEDIFYFYYREGTIPNDADGTSRWLKQRQKIGISDTEVKTETSESSKMLESQKNATNTPITPISIPTVDLNIVKQEHNEGDQSLERLCARFGQFCEPNGIKYKCSLCKVVSVETKEAMQSHLYEELRYRKWACSICSYKAFHKTGLIDHMTSEHKQIRDPVELPKDVDIEVWVAKLLDHQTTLIEKNKEKLYAQRIQVPVESPKKQSVEKPIETLSTSMDSRKKYDDKELEQAFGQFGVPDNKQFSCPKCQFKVGEAAVMHDHLESELTKIRWCCNYCSKNFQTYHEAQFHCRSAHIGQSARPTEALRDPAVRAAWVSAVITAQKSNMNCDIENVPSNSHSVNELTELPDAFENSLLAVRYEERVPTPEQTMQFPRKRPANEYDSEEERLVIDEPTTAESSTPDSSKYQRACPYCSFKGHYSAHHNHLVQHYNLKPITCSYCDFTDHRSQILAHLNSVHPTLPKRYKNTAIPHGPPPIKDLSLLSNKKEDIDKNSIEDGKLLCLICEQQVNEVEAIKHVHIGTSEQFAKKGCVVVKCGECLVLRKNIGLLEQHFATEHEGLPLNYAYFKIKTTGVCPREVLRCGNCDKRFQYLMDLRNHHNSVHRSLQISFSTENVTSQATTADVSLKRKSSDSTSALIPKKTARKSTTKLPKMVARKSTTKLPMTMRFTVMDSKEFSFYGRKPTPIDKYENVTTLMPFCNTMMPFKLKQLSEILNINPLVLVEDLNK